MQSVVKFMPRGAAVKLEFRHSGSDHWEPRLVIIWGVRSLEDKPLSTKAIVERPELDRSGNLLYAWDVTRGDWRRFYLHRVRNVQLTDLHPLLAMATAMQRSAEMNRRTA